MKVSLNWLKEYVDVDVDKDFLANSLTMAGLEVDNVTDRYDYLKGVISAKITDIKKHPGADRLQVVLLDRGDAVVTVVCGANNIEKNMIVPLVLPGTVLPGGMVIEKSQIRGVNSAGMLPSELELMLGADNTGVMPLNDVPIGLNLKEALNLSDYVFEIDLTPNRPDCLSFIGVAREVSVFCKKKMKYPLSKIYESDESVFDSISVNIDDFQHCMRYAARVVTNVTVGESPFWLKDRLLSIGLKPVNNIVDVTNFVMMETGQPLHAFDYDKIAEKQVVVRMADKDEDFVTLDKIARSLDFSSLMICDGEKPVALAGIMGGLNSQVELNTKKILIESAYFNPVTIRKTAKKNGLNTDASHRFERGVDPEGVVKALNRAAVLISEIGCGNLLKGVIDEKKGHFKKQRIMLSVVKANKILGLDLKPGVMAELLTSIGFDVTLSKNNKLDVISPSFRVDIEREEDLVEEIARLSGYDNIPVTFPEGILNFKKIQLKQSVSEKVKNFMLGCGFYEVINYSFINPSSVCDLRLSASDKRNRLVKILNPLVEEQSVLRSSLIPGLLKNMHLNNSRNIFNFKIFETGRVFVSEGKEIQPKETELFSGLWTGLRYKETWHDNKTISDFFDIKGVVEGLLNKLGVQNVRFLQKSFESISFTRVGYSADIVVADEIIGLIGEVNSEVKTNFDLKPDVFIFEISLEKLKRVTSETDVKIMPIPRFPSASRDMTIIIDKEIAADEVLRFIKKIKEDLIEDVFLFDFYEGSPIESGKKSISFRMIYRSAAGTLKDSDVNQVHTLITDQLINNFDVLFPV